MDRTIAQNLTATIMEGHAEEFDYGDIFVYRGGRVPYLLRELITRARIDESVKVISEYAFNGCTNLLDVETHGGITNIKRGAFNRCRSLRGIQLPGVKEVEAAAFGHCYNLTDADFGDRLESIDSWAFYCCQSLKRIAFPLKDIAFPLDHANHLGVYCRRHTQFDGCNNLVTVDLVGGTHMTISSLYMKRWRDELKEEVIRINRVLRNTPHSKKTTTIQQWIESVLQQIKGYKSEHNKLLTEATTLLELALWKAKLDEDKSEEGPLDGKAKRSKIDHESVREERRITSGASVVITNVLPFLQLA